MSDTSVERSLATLILNKDESDLRAEAAASEASRMPGRASHSSGLERSDSINEKIHPSMGPKPMLRGDRSPEANPELAATCSDAGRKWWS